MYAHRTVRFMKDENVGNFIQNLLESDENNEIGIVKVVPEYEVKTKSLGVFYEIPSAHRQYVEKIGTNDACVFEMSGSATIEDGAWKDLQKRSQKKCRASNKQPVYAINIRDTLFHEDEPWNFNNFGPSHSIIHGQKQNLMNGIQNSYINIGMFCETVYRHKCFLVDENLLLKHHIKYTKLIQYPGEFIFTLYGAFHWGWNAGFNVCESMNLASPKFKKIYEEVSLCKATCEYSAMPIPVHQKLGKLLQQANESQMLTLPPPSLQLSDTDFATNPNDMMVIEKSTHNITGADMLLTMNVIDYSQTHFVYALHQMISKLIRSDYRLGH
ncbi:uncharacterized protein LOC116349798 [Contarinia nasturtii]|uniref:uncharacterized protein LOC116349798 n=1 Tax=Contarinia nasturtii TaxID=265458 RepID=UPI0012D455A9|nr:uncharacterized protein LOC116349798 [Contarinia nasturtii]